MAKPVGYKSPPQHTRWKKGQSGNPAGRRKGQRNLKTDLEAELREVVQVTERGVPRRLTKQRALIKALTARAMAGDSRAANLVLNLMMRLLDHETPATADVPLSPEEQALLEAFLNRQRGSQESEP